MKDRVVRAVFAVAVVFAGSAVAEECSYTDGEWSPNAPTSEDSVKMVSGDLEWKSPLPMSVKGWTQPETYAGTVTFDTGLETFTVDGDVNLQGGTWTHTANPSLASSSDGWKSGRGTKQLIIRCSGDFTIGATAAVHGDVKGFLANQGPGCKIADYSQGSAHGSSGNGDGYKCYGSLFEPITIGSGGNQGGGGGAVRITCAKTLTVNGRLSADARAPVNADTWGLGSGGSIYISTKAIAGNGTISANGQIGRGGCADQRRGGGGRIAVYLTGAGEVFESFTGTISAYGTRKCTFSGDVATPSFIAAGVPGPIYIETAADEPHHGELRLVNGTVEPTYGRYFCLGADEGPYDFRKLVLSGAQLSVTSGVLVTIREIAGVSKTSAVLAPRGGTLVMPRQLVIANFTYGVYTANQTMSFIDGVGEPSVTVASTGILTVDKPFTVPCSLTVQNGGTVKQTTNKALSLTGANMNRMNLTVDGDFTVDAGGSVSAIGCGHWESDRGSGSSIAHSWDPAVHAGTANYLGVDKPYGSIVDPNTFGSMGNNVGANGGGVIRLNVSGDATVNGTISANGGSYYYCTGAGGSLCLSAKTLSGSGIIQADAGNTQGDAGKTKASSGGRVAVTLTGPEADFSGFTGLISAFGSEHSNSSSTKKDKNVFGAAGTVYLRKGGEGLHDGTLYVTNGSAAASVAWQTVINENMADSEVGNVVIAHNGRLLVNTNATLTIRGDLTRLAGGTLTCLGGDAAHPGSSVVFADATRVSKINQPETFYNLVITNAGKEVQFPAGEATTVAAGGRFAVAGAEGNLVKIRSSAAGTMANLTIEPGASADVSRADVKDSNANGLPISAKDSVDSGNNVGWSMSSIKPGDRIAWTGDESADWGNPNNWTDVNSKHRLPVDTDVVVIPDGSTGTPALPGEMTFNTLTVEPGKTLDLGGYSLTVTNALTVGGTLAVRGGETVSVARDVSINAISGGKVNLVVGSAADNQSVALGANAFGTVTVGTGSGDVAFSGSFSADRFAYAGTAVRVLAFAAGSTVTAAQLDVAGANGESAALTLASGTAGTAFDLKVTSIAFVSGVQVRDVNATGLDIYVDSPCRNLGGNNAKWHFGSTTARWIGGETGEMTNGLNWSSGAVPDANTRIVFDTTATMTIPEGETVNAREIVAQSGTVTVKGAGSLATAGAFVMEDGATVVLDVPLTVNGDAEIRSGAKISHTSCGTSVATTNRLMMTVNGDLTIAVGGSIDATGKGWTKGVGPGDIVTDGGAGMAPSHGGIGAEGTPCYGSTFHPITPGSGSKRAANATGGGVIRLVTSGTLTVNGLVAANAGTISGFNGSGGSIWINAGSLAGGGAIKANGGGITDTTWGAFHGGGGRLAVYLSQAANLDAFTGVVDVGGSRVTAAGNEQEPTGGAGTFYYETANDAEKGGTLVIDAGRSSVCSRGTDLPVNGNPQAVGDDDCAANYRNVRIVVKNGGRLNLREDVLVEDVDCPGSSAGFSLNDHELTIESREHYKRRGWCNAISVSAGGDRGKIVWKKPGLMLFVR